jgi:hypothetical protein
MAVANHEVQVTWSSSNSASVSGGATAASDTMSFSATAFDAMITLKADNSGTPASGDTVDFYALLSCGDPDGSGGDEFPNDDSDGIFLARLDTYADDPAIATVTIPVAKSVKIFAKNNASSNSVTVSACINEKTA